MIAEPEIGKIRDCVGCGFCCYKSPHYPGTNGICMNLEWDDKQDGIHGLTYRRMLYIGEGCCSGLNSWRREPLQNRTVVFND